MVTFSSNQGSVEQQLDRFSVPGHEALYQKEESLRVRCLACAHQCRISEGRRGVCRVRYNRKGVLYVPSGYVAGLQVDPIEKKPFYHVLPGSDALSFGMLVCNFHCDFCQNWLSSQTLRDSDALSGFQPCSAAEIESLAIRSKAASLISTYNEPLITADWAIEIFERVANKDILCGFVSNGYATPTVLEVLRPFMSLFKVDLKCFTEQGYRQVGGTLKPVLETISRLQELGFWVEIVTLVVPGFNDSAEELKKMAAFLASLSLDMPWHVTAFYPTYKKTDVPPTSSELLDKAWKIGKDAGLHYVYAGNLGGRGGEKEHTWCPACGTLLVERAGFRVQYNGIVDGKCPKCSASIAGKWH